MTSLFVLTFLGCAAKPGAVRLGVDVLEDTRFKALVGKRVGLVVNPASVAGDLTHTVDVLRRGDKAERFDLVALFGPEHGVYGDVYAGDKIEDRIDPRTGLPVFSLYGKTRKPTPEMLANLDALVFDMQDIGSRSYTYISTMSACLEACIEQDKTFVVLDRPNPLGGERIEGPRLDPDYKSFISFIDVPYVHGLTMGELARLERNRIDPDYKKLVVVKMDGWRRDMVWEETGLKWVPTSPHIPFASSTWAYAATGVIGELLVASNGVGYTLPFELVGMPGINAEQFADAVNEKLDDPAVEMRPAYFKPFYATHQGEVCGGVQLYVDPKRAKSLYELNFILLQALDAKALLEKGEKRHSSFDKANGTDQPRERMQADRPMEPLFELWREDCEQFRKERRRFLLYR